MTFKLADHPFLRFLMRFRDNGDGSFDERVVAGTTVAAVAAPFNRPADVTAYAVGDLVANDTVAGNVVPLQIAAGAGGRSLCVLRARVRKSGVTVANAAFRLHLWNSAPGVANGDNGAFSPSNVAGYLGAIDVTSMIAFSDGAMGQGVPLVGSAIACVLPTDTVYALLEARAAYVPANGETFTVTLEAQQD